METIGSLCSGYGGLDEGVRAATGATVVWHAEVDAAAVMVLEKREPGVPNLGDITRVDWAQVQTPDVLCAGFPCQPVSTAGRKGGVSDARWLWPAVRTAVETLMPPVVFLENVQNLTSIDGGRILLGILTDLMAAGYSCRWVVLGACRVGAAHHRHRWFLRADRGRAHAGAVRLAVKACGAPRTGGRLLLPSPRSTDAARGMEPNRGTRTGTGGTLGDAVASLLPKVLARDWKGVAPRLQRGQCLGSAVLMLPTCRASDGENGRGNAGQTYGSDPLPLGAAAVTHWGRFAQAVALWEDVSGLAVPQPVEPAPRGGLRLAAALPEWMMGLPAGYLTDLLGRSDAMRLAGNGVVSDQAAAAWALLA